MNSDAVILLETVNFAAGKHRNQRRKDTEETPYINHPIGRLSVIAAKNCGNLGQLAVDWPHSFSPGYYWPIRYYYYYYYSALVCHQFDHCMDCKG